MSALDRLPRLTGTDLRRLVGHRDAVDALERALAAGLDPDADPPRHNFALPAGDVLAMPGAYGGYAGLKIATVAPDNPARGLPRVQAVYLLLDAATLSPLALLDGIALTDLRTPAVSALAVRHLAAAPPRRLVVFGTGPQAAGHIEAFTACFALTDVVVVGRDPHRARALAARAAPKSRVRVVRAGEVAGELAAADVIACCTTARTPLFPAAAVPARATVVAVGSHQPDAREVDGELVRTATVVVESRSAALREAGDVIMALGTGERAAGGIAGDLADLVAGRVVPAPGAPRFFKSVGMAFEDLVVAALAYERSAP